MTEAFSKAIVRWKSIVGEDNVREDSSTLNAYERNASQLERKIPAVILPKTTQEVQDIVRVANENNTPIYPISQGKNWGMGSRVPAKDGCVVVDLGRMNQIREVNEKHGHAIIEAGVTQQQLYEFLSKNNSKYILGVTGSGSESSVIGNALEKGGEYFYCRFDRISGLEVVLGNGNILKTGFGHYAKAQNTHNFKYGVGPYLDGLLAQSNFGIVTSAGLSLIPKREVHSAFKCSIYNENNFPELVDRFAELRRTEILSTAAHIANRARTANVLSPAIFDYLSLSQKGSQQGIDKKSYAQLKSEAEKIVDQLAAPWSIAGGLMGTKAQVAEAQKQIQKAMNGIGDVTFMDEKKLNLAKWLIQNLSFLPPIKKLKPLIYAVEPIYDIIAKGKPSDLAIKTVYWPVEEIPENWKEPDQSNSGLLFSLPLIPNEGKVAQYTVRKTEEVFGKYGFVPYITLNMLTPTGLEVVINNAFDRTNKEQVKSAYECIRELNKSFITEGLIPYRVGIESMDLILDEKDTFWQTVRDLKKVLDPNDIISPGRYNLR